MGPVREALLRLLRAGAGDEPVEDLLALALPVLAETTGATGLALADPVGDGLRLGPCTGALPDGDPSAWASTGAGVALHDVELHGRATEMLAGDPVGERATRLLPDLRSALGLDARLLDGSALVVDVLIAPLPHAGDDEQAWHVVFVEDASARLEREGLTARLQEARMRRRQALEINDNVEQGLVAACYALDAERYPEVATYLRRTLDAARSMMNDLLDPLTGEELGPGALVRRTPAALDAPLAPVPDPVEPGGGLRVLVVDDAADLRLLARTVLDRVGGLTVVGEAVDGLDGVEQATVLQPDLVVLAWRCRGWTGSRRCPASRRRCPGCASWSSAASTRRPSPTRRSRRGPTLTRQRAAPCASSSTW